ncbi:hypothetical protein GCM10022403_097990 [Streptomyces coacervatus]|uniref:Transposase IS701-like DDE domain-containing protein n=1 Tax=Streptomyces coacervatus TaxID=647381 RepID=A0ABP7JPX1_9ACTN|nr:hypothetical protein [Streptomyces coacervatus]MDF2263958.1 hypothetical protein [Streptomyces coacervatus]
MFADGRGRPLSIAWVTADAAYGQEWRFRRMLEEASVGYVLAVPKSQLVPRFGRIDHLFSQAPDEAWEQRSCGDGAKGPPGARITEAHGPHLAGHPR